VAGMACVQPGGLDPNPDLAFDIVNRMMEKGVLLFSPVGFGGATIKICPPLCITEAAMLESLDVLDECFADTTDTMAAQ